MIWFTSDLHFLHKNIRDHQPNRKAVFGDTMVEHDKALLEYWNKTVSKKDTIYIIGDLAFGQMSDKHKLFHKLNGNKVLIMGNHDKVPDYLESCFNCISTIKEMVFIPELYPFLKEPFKLVMCHFPLLTWNHKTKGYCMVHGHCHGKLDDFNKESQELRVDVGIDGNLANHGFISLEQLYDYFKKVAKQSTLLEYSTKTKIK